MTSEKHRDGTDLMILICFKAIQLSFTQIITGNCKRNIYRNFDAHLLQ